MITAQVIDKKERIRTQANDQRFNSRLSRVMVIFLMSVSFLTLPIWSVFLLIGGVGPGMFSEAPPYIGFIILILVYGSFFVIPFLICLPIIWPMAIKQKNTARIAVFRKFNDEKCKRALSKIIRAKLAYYGHVFTLSDSKFKVKWYVRIPVFLGQVSLFHFRQQVIKNSGQVERFKQSLNNITLLNVNWLFSGSKVFPVKTTDEYWKDTAGALLSKNSLIIFDISFNSDSLDWEIAEVQKLGYEPNIIAVAAVNNKAEADNWRNQYDIPDDNEIPIFYYNDKGQLEDETAFENCVVGKLVGFQYDEAVISSSKEKLIKRTLYSGAVVLLLFLGSLFFMSPYILPDYVALHSPFPRQVATAYIQSRLHNYLGNELVLGRVRDRIGSDKLSEKVAAHIINKAKSHYKSECDAVQAALREINHPALTASYLDLALHAEPVIAETAFEVLQSINTSGNMDDFALELMQSPRIFLRLRAIKSIEKKVQDSVLANKLLTVLIKASAEIKPEPYQHFSSGLFEGFPKFINDFKYDDYLEAEQKYYDKVYQLLDKTTSFLTIDRLKKLIQDDKAPGLRLAGAMLLAKLNNASGAGLVSNATFTRGDDRAGVSVGNGKISMKYTANYIYKDRADSLLYKLKQPSDMPSIDQLLLTINSAQKVDHEKTNFASASLIVFAIRHYSIPDFNKFITGLAFEDTVNLPEALHYVLDHEPSSLRGHILQCIELSKQKIKPILASEDIETRLSASLLLAYAGDISVAKVAVDAGKIKQHYKLFNAYSRPYSTDAEKILQTLYKHMHPPYNARLVEHLEPESESEEEKILNNIIYKVKRYNPKNH